MRTVTPAGMAAEWGRRQGWLGRWMDVHAQLLLHTHTHADTPGRKRMRRKVPSSCAV